MANSNEKKLGLYLDQEAKDILDAAAAGLDRPPSWVVQQAIKHYVPAMMRRYFKIIEVKQND